MLILLHGKSSDTDLDIINLVGHSVLMAYIILSYYIDETLIYSLDMQSKQKYLERIIFSHFV